MKCTEYKELYKLYSMIKCLNKGVIIKKSAEKKIKLTNKKKKNIYYLLFFF